MNAKISLLIASVIIKVMYVLAGVIIFCVILGAWVTPKNKVKVKNKFKQNN